MINDIPKTDKVFLGGTCNDSTWRDELIPLLDSYDIRYFNPVVKDWDEDFQKIEIQEKEAFCNIHLYVITKETIGAFSIAEAIESSMTKDKITILQVIPKGFKLFQLQSYKAICDMVIRHGQYACINSKLTNLPKIIKQVGRLNAA